MASVGAVSTAGELAAQVDVLVVQVLEVGAQGEDGELGLVQVRARQRMVALLLDELVARAQRALQRLLLLLVMLG